MQSKSASSLRVIRCLVRRRFGRYAPESGLVMFTLSFVVHDPKRASRRIRRTCEVVLDFQPPSISEVGHIRCYLAVVLSAHSRGVDHFSAATRSQGLMP